MRRAVLPVVLILLVWVDAWAFTQQDLEQIRASKRIDAVRVDQPIRLDGILDEPAWERATPAIDFHQQQPAEFEQATRKTEVRFLYDDEMSAQRHLRGLERNPLARRRQASVAVEVHAPHRVLSMRCPRSHRENRHVPVDSLAAPH